MQVKVDGSRILVSAESAEEYAALDCEEGQRVLWAISVEVAREPITGAQLRLVEEQIKYYLQVKGVPEVPKIVVNRPITRVEFLEYEGRPLAETVGEYLEARKQLRAAEGAGIGRGLEGEAIRAYTLQERANEARAMARMAAAYKREKSKT